MSWFVAMHEALFPFIRDLCPARFIVVHIGSTQQGKTSGAQRFTLLHGLGEVKGDYSPAALASLGDVGLLVMDNKEQANLTQPFVDHCLYLSTGAERGRCTQDGMLRPRGVGRPVGMITTIEGMCKAELRSRCIDVQYGVAGLKLPRAPIERNIQERRHEIGSVIVMVLQRYMQIRSAMAPRLDHPHCCCPVPDFEEHYSALCDLLQAYAEIAGKPKGWSDGEVRAWGKALTSSEPEEDDLEHPLSRILFPREHHARQPYPDRERLSQRQTGHLVRDGVRSTPDHTPGSSPARPRASEECQRSQSPSA
jgi:hypothetical protein